MSYARTLRRTAQNVFQSFTYYVDPVSGSDGAAGLRSAPFLTLAHALSTASAGQSIGIKRGTTTRAAASITSTLSDVRIGAYGVGAKPIITGGKLVTSWTGATLTLGSEMVTNPGFESALTTGWTVAVAGPVQDSTIHHSGSDSMKITNGTGKLTQNFSLTAGQQYALSFWHIESVTAKSGSIQLFTGTNYMQANGTFSTSSPTRTTPNSTTWAQVTYTFTAPTTGSYTLLLQGFDGGTYTTNYDDVSLKQITGSTGPVYSAGLSSAPAGTPGMVVAGGTALTLGSSTSPSSGQWFWASNVLYVNLGGTDPGTVTVEVASVTDVVKFNTASQSVTLRNLDVRFGVNAGISLSGIGRFIVDRCNLAYGVYTSNSGYMLINNCTGGGRIVRNTFDTLVNDGIWGHNTPNVEIAYNTMTNIGSVGGDVQSDGIQWEDTFGSSLNSTGLWIHHNTISMGAASPKGCILVNADPSLGSISSTVEHNTCIGGNYGVAPHANNTIVRYNTCTGQVTAFGGNIHIDSTYVLDSIAIYRNLLINCNRDGLVVQSGANNRTNFTFINNTIINPGAAGWRIGSPISGQVTNNIISYVTLPSFKVGYIVAPAGTLVVDYNAYGPDASGFLENVTTSYSTLAAWRSATGYDTHSISGDPLISAPLYIPAGGSPALNAGTVVSPITDGYSGSAPDMGYAEAA